MRFLLLRNTKHILKKNYPHLPLNFHSVISRRFVISILNYFVRLQEYPDKLSLKSKKTHNFKLRDAMADIYGGHEKVPKTLIVPNLIATMKQPDGTFVPGLACMSVPISCVVDD